MNSERHSFEIAIILLGQKAAFISSKYLTKIPPIV
jgi:hypothetical protein